jgi:cytochrome c oxidase subunit II
MRTSSQKVWIAVILVLGVVVLVVGTIFIASLIFSSGPTMGWGQSWRGRVPFTSFASNGERIYFTGTSDTGPPVSSETPGMHRMPAGRMACADCHGADGRGGNVRMMMSSFDAPDIRYRTLTEEDHGDAHGEHPPYTDEDIKRAITEGVDPAGEPLEWMMPRWTMTDGQLEDVINFLKTLD